MLDKQKHIDDAVKDRLDGFELNPPVEAWGAIESAVASKSKKGLWFFFGSIVLIGVLCSAYFMTQNIGLNNVIPKDLISNAAKQEVSAIERNQNYQLYEQNSASTINKASNQKHSANQISDIESTGDNIEDLNSINNKKAQSSDNLSNKVRASNLTHVSNNKPTNNHPTQNALVDKATASPSNTSSNQMDKTAAAPSNTSPTQANKAHATKAEKSNTIKNESPNTGIADQKDKTLNSLPDNSETDVLNTLENNALKISLKEITAEPIDIIWGDPSLKTVKMGPHGRVFPRWRAYAGIGVNSFKQSLSFITPNQNLETTIQNAEERQAGLSFEGGLAYYLTPGLFVESGYQYKSFSENYTFNSTETVTTVQIDTTGAYQDSITGDTIYITSTTIDTNVITSQGSTNNRYKIHSVPLMFGYTWAVSRRLNLDVAAGAEISVFSNYSGSVIGDEDYSLMDINSSHKTSGVLSGRANIRMNYLFGERHAIYLGFGVSKQLSTFNNTNLPYDRKLRFTRLSAGYRIIF